MDINDSSARIRDLEHTVGEKEREIEMLKDSVKEMNGANPVSDERVKSLERQVNEIDGMVRGLTAEMLDLKAWIQKLSKSLEEKAAIKKKEPVAVKERKNYPDVEKPVDVAVKKTEDNRRREEKEKAEEVLIIQPDGTMKPERMKGDGMIIADHRGGRGPVRRGGERDPRDRKPLIYADDEDDSIEITKKRK